MQLICLRDVYCFSPTQCVIINCQQHIKHLQANAHQYQLESPQKAFTVTNCYIQHI